MQLARDMSDFIERIESKVEQQLGSQRVAFLLGAGSAHLRGTGYPLAGELWNVISAYVPVGERVDIQKKFDEGAGGLETALDLLDDGGAHETPHRHSVTKAIAEHFRGIDAPLETHAEFLSRLSKRNEWATPIFSLNYDPLLERAADTTRLCIVDGFQGVERGYFSPDVFQKRTGLVHKGYRGSQWRLDTGAIHLFKLHGSIGWYEPSPNDIRRCGFSLAIPPGATHLMIPPQNRKASDTMTPPYSSLWSEFRGMLKHGPFLVNRLVSIGYGMCDEHVNVVIENALARPHFTLMIFALGLKPEVIQRWSPRQNVIIVTNESCSLAGETGPGHPDLWDFARLSKEV